MNKLFVVGALLVASLVAGAAERELSLADYREKMKAAWMGQIIGMSYGSPMKWDAFKPGEVIPVEKMPKWQPHRIMQDHYFLLQMTFVRTLECHGLNVTAEQAGIDFAATEYAMLPNFRTSNVTRTNLRKGIAPPDCAHPKNMRGHANSADYQMSSDFTGILAPGCPQESIRLGRIFGSLLNFGDGVWAGQFVGALYAEAFFTQDINQLLDAGLAAIPAESDFAQMVRNVRAWHKEFPNDWLTCREKILSTYSREYNAHVKNKAFALKDAAKPCEDARFSGARLVMTLLYGQGDFDKSMEIYLRGDRGRWPAISAHVGGLLWLMKGHGAIPSVYLEKFDPKAKFPHVKYNFDELIVASEKLARQIVAQHGGRITKDATGEEKFVIPVKAPQAEAFVPSWQAPAPTGARYSEDTATVGVQKALDMLAPGWKTSPNGFRVGSGYVDVAEVWDLSNRRAAYHAREGFIRTQMSKECPSVTFSRRLKLPAGTPVLSFEASNTPAGDKGVPCLLMVRVDGALVLKTHLESGGQKGWYTHALQRYNIPLARWAGREATVELVTQALDTKTFGGVLWRNLAITSDAK